MKDKCVLITGATGTFGSAFVPRILDYHSPSRVVVFSRDELKQSEMAAIYHHDDRLRFFLGDVRDRDRLKIALKGIDVVIHAAALKQIPAGEYDPHEFIKTNIGGTQNVLMEAQSAGAQKVLVLSSDKAAAPLTLYGSTKNIAEHLARTANHYDPGGCISSALRYGNVAGSRGSVIPLWRGMIANGAKVLPITHPGMTRFFFSVKDAVDFALWSLDHMKGGELFVPRMKSFNVTDLAEAMGCQYTISGIRGAEKLSEVMVTSEEARYFRRWEGIFVRFPDGILEGDSLPEGFEYRSDNNPEWLSVDALKALLSCLP